MFILHNFKSRAIFQKLGNISKRAVLYLSEGIQDDN